MDTTVFNPFPIAESLKNLNLERSNLYLRRKSLNSKENISKIKSALLHSSSVDDYEEVQENVYEEPRHVKFRSINSFYDDSNYKESNSSAETKYERWFLNTQ